MNMPLCVTRSLLRGLMHPGTQMNSEKPSMTVAKLKESGEELN